LVTRPCVRGPILSCVKQLSQSTVVGRVLLCSLVVEENN
jgi:hypothetical protein